MRLAAVVLLAAVLCAHAAPAPTDQTEVPTELQRNPARVPAIETQQPLNFTEHNLTKAVSFQADHSSFDNKFGRRPTCGDKLGYLTMSNVKWVNAVEQRASNEYHAEKMCDNDPDCGGFNSYGCYTTNGVPSDFTPYAGLCTYIKSTVEACTDYPGYFTLSNTNWSGSSDKQATSTEAARAACDADANCAAFNNYYYYTTNQPDPKGYIQSMGLCSYVKASAMPNNHDEATEG